MSKSTANPTHKEVQAEILSRIIDLGIAGMSVIGFGSSAVYSFPMRLAVLSFDDWRRLESELRRIGLNADLHGSSPHRGSDGMTLRIEVHVKPDWKRPKMYDAAMNG